MKYNSKFNDAHASLAHQNLYNIVEENDKDLTKWKVMPCSYTGRSDVLKMSIFPKLTCRFNIIPMKC